MPPIEDLGYAIDWSIAVLVLLGVWGIGVGVMFVIALCFYKMWRIARD